ncbi:MAG: hypothetical protein WDO18_12430 [Acidobacteriota bacterium]
MGAIPWSFDPRPGAASRGSRGVGGIAGDRDESAADRPVGRAGTLSTQFLGDRTKYLSWFLVAIFIPMGYYFARSWFFWAAILIFFGMRHPSLVDEEPIGPVRTRLAWFALFMLVVCFTPSPIR